MRNKFTGCDRSSANLYSDHYNAAENSMTTLKELIAQKEALERQIEETTAHGRETAIAKIRELMAENGVSLTDLGGRGTGKSSGKKTSPTGKKVAAKYRDKATGDSWSGRGLQPKWLNAALASGKKIEEFAV